MWPPDENLFQAGSLRSASLLPASDCRTLPGVFVSLQTSFLGDKGQYHPSFAH